MDKVEEYTKKVDDFIAQYPSVTQYGTVETEPAGGFFWSFEFFCFVVFVRSFVLFDLLCAFMCQ